MSMRPLEEIRVDIDSIDAQIKELLMKRLDLSEQVIASKIESKNYVINRPDREAAMLNRLGEGIPEKRKAGYLSVVRKITETSRMYQYGILYEQARELFEELVKDIALDQPTEVVTIRLTRPNVPNAMSAILSMIGDYGYDMDQMKLLEYSSDMGRVTFELKILGDLTEEHMQKMMLQLSMESMDFSVIEAV